MFGVSPHAHKVAPPFSLSPGFSLALTLYTLRLSPSPSQHQVRLKIMDENDEVPYEASNFFRPRAQTWPCKVFDSYDGENTSLISSADVNNITINTSNDSAIGSEVKSVINGNGNSAPVSTSPSSASSANSTSNTCNAQLTAKKSNSRRNAWGSASYADLITQAINNSPDKRLTLSQIYEWMVQNVPYFKDKGDSNSSAGWKNSIRHNLSLHSRFMRIQNEGTGKSSWWVINPEAKPGKAARRRAASMETSKFERKRGRVKKKIANMKNGIIDAHSPSSSVSEGLDTFPESPPFSTSGNHFTLSPGEFRPRASSNASSCGRLSPIPGETDMHDSQVPPLSPWNTDLQQVYGVSDTDVYADQLAEMTSANMKLGGSNNSLSGVGGGNVTCVNGTTTGATVNNDTSSFLTMTSKGSSINSLSPASSQITLTPSTYGFGSSLSVNGGVTYVNNLNGGSGSGTLSRNGSDPFFQTSAGIDGSITLTSLNAPPSEQRSPSSRYLDSSCATPVNLSSLSPSLSPAQSMDTINGLHNSTFTPISQPVALMTGVTNIKQEFCGFNPQSIKIENTAQAAASQVMGHILTLNSTLPNDLDFDTLQGGLECDVNSVIQHELSVEGNLEFNFDPAAAAAAAANNNNNTSVSLAHGASTRSWVH